MDNKNKPGRPKSQQTKKAFSLRLSKDVIDIIRSKPNQVAYIEALVRNNGLGEIKNKWISVSDKLPEMQVAVLVYMPKYGLPNIYVMWRLDIHNGESWMNVNWDIKPLQEATHWQPLPESPLK